MDACDLAQIVSDQWLAGQLHRRRSDRAQSATVGQLECVDCGEPIPAGRRAAVPQADRCVACQAKAESTIPCW